MANEINSDLIKLPILRLVRGKKHGEYKWNLLAGIAAGQSSVEIALGTTFDPSTKYQAIVCFDELKSDGFIVPNVSTFNTNPDRLGLTVESSAFGYRWSDSSEVECITTQANWEHST